MSDTVLIKAARAGDRDKCVHLLKDMKAGDVSKRGVGRKTAVIAAAEGGHLDIVELLLEHGASILDKDKDRNTILMLALKAGNMKLAELLLSKGANIHDIDKDGNSSITNVFIYCCMKLISKLPCTVENLNLLITPGSFEGITDLNEKQELIATLFSWLSSRDLIHLYPGFACPNIPDNLIWKNPYSEEAKLLHRRAADIYY